MDALRIIRYAERRFQQSGETAFPTVREVARGCRVRQKDVEAACEDTGLACLQGYNIEHWKRGDLEVYVYDPIFPHPITKPDAAAE